MKSSGIGGQAVLEGVMMKNKDRYAVAVRTAEGDIAIQKGKCKSLADRSLFFRLPIIRGVAAFVESLTLGLNTLTYSASFYEEEEEEKRKDKSKKSKSKEEEKKQKEKKEKIEMGLTLAFSIVIAVAFFMILPLVLSNLLQSKIESKSVLALIEGVIRIGLFLGYVAAISCMSDIKRVFMYHGAEHKSINCIENGFELTVENVRKQSKHHKRCGTSFCLIVMFISVVFFMVIYFENIWLRILTRILLVPVIAGVSYEFIKLAGNTENKFISVLSIPGMLLQRLTTREPDDAMIEVAIKSVEEVFDWREYQRRSKIGEQSRFSKKKKKKDGEKKVRKSRAQQREELLQREKENKNRANERARRIKEQEEKEAELERIAEAAIKNKAARHAMLNEVQEDDEILSKLDFYFDKEEKDKEKKDNKKSN